MNEAGETSRPPARDKTSLPFPLQDSELVLQVCRRHWLYLWPAAGLQALLGLVPVLAAALLLDRLGIDGIAAAAVWLVVGLHVVYRDVRIFLTWYRYQHDIWVITNQRLIDNYKRHPFSLRVSTADLVNVQDMAVSREGILRTLLDYGDIVCQTASADQDFRLAGIPDPRGVQALVDRERDRERLRAGR